MRTIKTTLTLLLAILWLPVSSHALLERAGMIHEVHADHDSDNHDAADGKCALSSNHVNIPMRAGTSSLMLFYTLGLDLVSELHITPPTSGLPPPGTVPPQLSHCWQFSLRTALPARAPSLIS